LPDHLGQTAASFIGILFRMPENGEVRIDRIWLLR
jgi:hypothetical protein